MTRKRIVENKPVVDLTELQSIISDYVSNKEKEREYKDLASVENTKIKAVMEELAISECEDSSGNNIAKISEQKKESFVEDKLIDFLKKNNVANDIIKTKEYVDYDALENAIYHGIISDELVKDMASCKETKITKVLRISKVKGE